MVMLWVYVLTREGSEIGGPAFVTLGQQAASLG
jgi:hypothetical protein